MAITACEAKVSKKRDLFFRERRTSFRRIVIVPMATPHGVAAPRVPCESRDFCSGMLRKFIFRFRGYIMNVDRSPVEYRLTTDSCYE